MHAERISATRLFSSLCEDFFWTEIENGANPCIRDYDGETPLEKALKLRNCHVAIALAKFNCT